MVVGGIPGAGINTAIPVSHLRQSARPEILFTPPAVSKPGINQSFDFTAKTVSLIPDTKPLELELVLGTGDKKARRFPMTMSDGTYHAKAIPFPEETGPLEVVAILRFGDGLVRGVVEDRQLHVGDRSIKLSQIRRFIPGASPQVFLDRNEKISGALKDLENITFKLNGQPVTLDPATALDLTVIPPDDPATIACTIEARQQGKTIGRLTVPLVIEGVGRTSLDALREGEFARPLRSGARYRQFMWLAARAITSARERPTTTEVMNSRSIETIAA